MGLLQKLKSLLGLGNARSQPGSERDVGVTVEREGSNGANGTEPAVDDATLDEEAAASGTPASGSTGSMTDPSTDPDQAAEPAEAAGPAETDATPTEDKVPEQDHVESAIEPDETATEPDEPATEPDESSDGDAGEPETDADDAADGDVDESEAAPDDESEPGQDDDESVEPVNSIKGIGPAYADRLAAAGVETVAELADADAADLATQTDISEKRIQGWIDRAAVR